MEDDGYMALVRAVLLTALKDLSSRAPGIRGSAEIWVQRKKDCGYLSFEGACRILGFDATWLREKLATLSSKSYRKGIRLTKR